MKPAPPRRQQRHPPERTFRGWNLSGSGARLAFAAAFLLLIRGVGGLLASPAGTAESPGRVEIAAALSLTGEAQPFGAGSLEGVRLALEEANAGGQAPRIDLTLYDDGSTAEGSQTAARKIVASKAA